MNIDMFLTDDSCRTYGETFGAKCIHDLGCRKIEKDEHGLYVCPEYLQHLFYNYEEMMMPRFVARGFTLDQFALFISKVHQYALQRIDDTYGGRLPNTAIDANGFPVGI